MLRRIEVVLGLLTAVAGPAGVAYALFAPTGQWVSEELAADGSVVARSSGTTRLIDEGIGFALLGFLAIVALAAFLVGLRAYSQDALGNRGG